MPTQQQTFESMGSRIRLTLVSPHDTTALLKHLHDTVLGFELRYSRFLPNSNLTLLNRRAGQRVGISKEFHDILSRSLAMGQATGGLFNPFVLPALQRAGYLRSLTPAYADEPVPDYTLREVPAIDQLQLGDTWVELPLRSALDLGGCGKGYIGDRLADIIDETPHITGYWLSIGGDVIVRGTHETGAPIRVGLPHTQGTETAEFIVPAGNERLAVATSSTLKRKGEHDGRKWHHIINPRTLRPAITDVETATVAAPSLFEADIHATNCIIIGSPKAADYLVEQGITTARLMLSDGHNRYFDPAHKIDRRHSDDSRVP